MAETEATVLVVDDCEPVRYATARILQRAGFTVVQAGSGEEALRFVTKGGIDIAVLDVKLPDISGLDVCRTIERDRPDIMVLQLSATYVTSGDRIKGLDSGADYYLGQPVEPADSWRRWEPWSASAMPKLRYGSVKNASAPSPKPCPRSSGRPSRTEFTITSMAAGTAIPAARPGMVTAADARQGWCWAVHADDLARVTDAWLCSLASGEPFEIECRLRSADATSLVSRPCPSRPQ